jgi:hypothetical protein
MADTFYTIYETFDVDFDMAAMISIPQKNIWVLWKGTKVDNKGEMVRYLMEVFLQYTSLSQIWTI